MVQQLLHTILVSAISITWGIPFLLMFHKKWAAEQFWFHSLQSLLAFVFFLGCIALSILSSWVCLVAPLNFYYLLLSTVCLAAYLFYFKWGKILAVINEAKKLRSPVQFIEYLYIVTCILLFIGLGSLKPANFDTQIYHLQIIRWQAEYGTVPGIANLFPRFGQGSNWFNLISFFRIPSLRHENLSYVNVSFVSWFFIWLFSKWKYHVSKQNSNKNILALFYFSLFFFFMLDWQLYRDAANSTNYDFEVTAFLIMVISYFIEEIVKNKPRTFFSFTLSLFALALVSFKFSGIFSLFLVLYYLIINGKLKHWIITVAIGLVIAVPVLIRNYITSGYPFFPHPFSIGSPDWQLPKALAVGNYWYILNYNRFFNFWFVIDKVAHKPLNWIPFWFRGILFQHKIILCLALSSVVFLFVKLNININYSRLKHLIIILLLMIAGWFFTAPDPGRFGYGVLLPTAFLVTSILLGPFFYESIYKILLFAGVIVVGTYTFRKTKPLFMQSEFLVVPMSTEQPPYKTIIIKGVAVHLPDIINDNWDHRCYNTVLPCTCQKNPYLQPRSKNLKDGFKMAPNPDSSFLRHYQY